jgi:hypothetical protein
MKMKVGDILKKDVKNVPGMNCPYKIMSTDKLIYTQLQKIENSLLLNYCDTVMNSLPSSHNSSKEIHRSQSISRNKHHLLSKFYNSQNFQTSKMPLKKYSMSLGKEEIKNKLPLIKNNSSSIKSYITKNTRKLISDFILEPTKNSENTIKKSLYNNNYTDKNINKNIDKLNNLDSYRGITPNKYSRNTRNNNLMYYQAKTINNTFKIKFHIRCERKYKYINNMIKKLNKQLFVNSKTIDYN